MACWDFFVILSNSQKNNFRCGCPHPLRRLLIPIEMMFFLIWAVELCAHSPGKIAIIFQSVELLSGGDRDRAQIVGSAARVRQVEKSDVVLTFGLVAIAAPDRSRVDGFDPLLELVEQVPDRGPGWNCARSGSFARRLQRRWARSGLRRLKLIAKVRRNVPEALGGVDEVRMEPMRNLGTTSTTLSTALVLLVLVVDDVLVHAKPLEDIPEEAWNSRGHVWWGEPVGLCRRAITVCF